MGGGPIYVDRQNPNNVYAVQTQLGGTALIRRSFDGGSSWTTILTGTLRSENFVRDQDEIRFRQYCYSPQKQQTSTLANFYEFAGEADLAKSRPSAENCTWLLCPAVLVSCRATAAPPGDSSSEYV